MNRSKEWLAVLIVGLVGGVVAILFSWVRWPVPTIHDEFSHLLVADTLLQGRLSNPTPPVWPVFQAEHVVVTPTYASKYPLGPGALLALGRLVTGTPQGGLWIGAFMASAAVVWMVRGLTTLRIAVWAGLMVALHPYLQSVWSQAFVNGWLAMASACLVVGGAIRLRRRWSGPVAAVFACGAVGLALTRPMEGLICVIFAAVFFLTKAVSLSSVWRRGLSPMQCCWFLIPGVAGMLLLLAHHHAVTGRLTQMPYQLHEQQYGVAPLWIFQKPQTPTWLPSEDQPAADPHQSNTSVNRTDEDQAAAKPVDSISTMSVNGTILEGQIPKEILHYHLGWSMDCYRNRASLKGWIEGVWERLRSGFEYFGLISILAAVGMIQTRKWNKVRLVALGAFALFGVSTLVPWIMPHYYSPLLPWLIILSVVAIRYSPIRHGAGRRDFSRSKLIMICLLGWQVFLLSIEARGLSAYARQNWSHQRTALEQGLMEKDGRHLILVRYSKHHNVHDEWVYNQADFDSAQVLWARSWDTEYDSQLLRHFGKTHQIWVVEPDAEVIELKEYSPLSSSAGPNTEIKASDSK